MTKKRTACLTDYEAQLLQKLYTYQTSTLASAELPGFGTAKHLGGSRQSHHAKTLRRLAERGLCESRAMPVSETATSTAYGITEMGRAVWEMYCDYTGRALQGLPKIREFFR